MGEGPPILIRCDGSPEIGFGHVVRCLALADELRYDYRCRVVFAMRRGREGFDAVRAKGYPVLTPVEEGSPFDQARWIEGAIAGVGAKALVLDVRDDLRREDVERLRGSGTLIALVDDLSDRRLAADIAFYPPIPQVERLDWTGFGGKLRVGWDVVLLRMEFSRCAREEPAARPLVLVTMGGSDPAGMTLKALRALDLLEEDFETLAILGPGFLHGEALSGLLAGGRRRCEVMRDIKDMAAVMVQADLAVASFGVTAYELAAAGVPAIHLCLTEDHAESAAGLVREGAAVSMGVHGRVTEQELAGTVARLLADEPARKRMGERARNAVDGRGAERIAREILGRIGGGG
ncbi:MAG: hypothetical protein M0Z38_04845 [Deltaproteobacteria bacterium]|nr:hypothetical protein [Deltaproteobacteria bacterium]